MAATHDVFSEFKLIKVEELTKNCAKHLTHDALISLWYSNSNHRRMLRIIDSTMLYAIMHGES